MVVIRKVGLTYIDKLLDLSRKTFFDAFLHLNDPVDMEAYASVAFSIDKLTSELNNPNSEFYFILVDDEIAGYSKLNYGTAQTELNDNTSIEVERIYVLSDYQGKQIGKQLMDFAIKTAIDKELKYIWLGVWENNDKAIKFYEKNGFKIFGSHDFMLGAEKQTDLLMKKEV